MQVNVSLRLSLGRRRVQVGDKILGVCDGLTIEITEATLEEIKELAKADEIRLVKIHREEPP